MIYQEQVIHMTEQANAGLLRAIRATPEDKREWKVMDASRTALDLVRECAQSPLWFALMLEERSGTAFNLEEYPKMLAERSAWSLDDCERIMRENTERLAAAIRAIPDEDLQQTLTLPFGGRMVLSLADVMVMPYWNVTYHLGQINFIQVLLGDREMH